MQNLRLLIEKHSTPVFMIVMTFIFGLGVYFASSNASNENLADQQQTPQADAVGELDIAETGSVADIDKEENEDEETPVSQPEAYVAPAPVAEEPVYDEDPLEDEYLGDLALVISPSSIKVGGSYPYSESVSVCTSDGTDIGFLGTNNVDGLWIVSTEEDPEEFVVSCGSIQVTIDEESSKKSGSATIYVDAWSHGGSGSFNVTWYDN